MKKIFIIALSGVFALSMNAQDLVKGSKLTDNWSVGLKAGGVTPLKHSSLFENVRPAFGLELNKQVTPILGFTLEGMAYVNTSSSRTAIDGSNVSLLSRFNLNNLFGRYTGTPRAFEVEAVGGLGWFRSYVNGASDIDDLSSKVGLNFNFNLGESKAWTLALKPALVYNLEGAGKGVQFNANHAFVELTAGLVYHFKGSNGKRYITLEQGYNQSEIDGLNAKINDLRGQVNNAQARVNDAERKNAELQQQLNECLNRKPVVQQVVEATPSLESVVTFRQGRATIDAAQLPNVERVATYLKNHPEANVVIKGYASPEGSAEVNAKIAKQRAEVVKSTLVSKYKIAADRITAEGMGVGNLFEEADWNRVSICTINTGK